MLVSARELLHCCCWQFSPPWRTVCDMPHAFAFPYPMERFAWRLLVLAWACRQSPPYKTSHLHYSSSSVFSSHLRVDHAGRASHIRLWPFSTTLLLRLLRYRAGRWAGGSLLLLPCLIFVLLRQRRSSRYRATWATSLMPLGRRKVKYIWLLPTTQTSLQISCLSEFGTAS